METKITKLALCLMAVFTMQPSHAATVCTHFGGNIACPPGVAAGSTSVQDLGGGVLIFSDGNQGVLGTSGACPAPVIAPVAPVIVPVLVPDVVNPVQPEPIFPPQSDEPSTFFPPGQNDLIIINQQIETGDFTSRGGWVFGGGAEFDVEVTVTNTPLSEDERFNKFLSDLLKSSMSDPADNGLRFGDSINTRLEAELDRVEIEFLENYWKNADARLTYDESIETDSGVGFNTRMRMAFANLGDAEPLILDEPASNLDDSDGDKEEDIGNAILEGIVNSGYAKDRNSVVEGEKIEDLDKAFVKLELERLGKSKTKSESETGSGSNFIKDTRNIFLNPAAVNEYKNYVVTEWGKDSASDASDANEEGGFFREAGSFAYGVYLGNNTKRDNKYAAGEYDASVADNFGEGGYFNDGFEASSQPNWFQEASQDVYDDYFDEHSDLETFFESFDGYKETNPTDVHSVIHEVQGVIAPS